MESLKGSGAADGATGVSEPLTCRFRRLQDALNVAEARGGGTVLLIGALEGGRMESTDVTWPLVVPAGVRITSESLAGTFTPERYRIVHESTFSHADAFLVMEPA